MSILRSHVLAIALASLLAGCATSPAKTDNALFLLRQGSDINTSDTAMASAPSSAPVVVVDQLTLAPYLKGDGMVYQTAPNRIVIASDHRWAAPLQAQLLRGLRHALSARLNGSRIRRAGAVSQPDYRLSVHIQQFQGRYDGNAVISGHWRLLGRHDAVIGQGDFQQLTALKHDGYSALARALSRGWARVKQRLVQAVQQGIARQQA